MNGKVYEDFKNLLELPEDERLAQLVELSGCKLHLHQKIQLKMLNKWWTNMREYNPHLDAGTLFESIYKGRF